MHHIIIHVHMHMHVHTLSFMVKFVINSFTRISSLGHLDHMLGEVLCYMAYCVHQCCVCLFVIGNVFRRSSSRRTTFSGNAIGSGSISWQGYEVARGRINSQNLGA